MQELAPPVYPSAIKMAVRASYELTAPLAGVHPMVYDSPVSDTCGGVKTFTTVPTLF